MTSLSYACIVVLVEVSVEEILFADGTGKMGLELPSLRDIPELNLRIFWRMAEFCLLMRRNFTNMGSSYRSDNTYS